MINHQRTQLAIQAEAELKSLFEARELLSAALSQTKDYWNKSEREYERLRIQFEEAFHILWTTEINVIRARQIMIEEE